MDFFRQWPDHLPDISCNNPDLLCFVKGASFFLSYVEENQWRQECIPVGCVSAAHWPYGGGGGGVGASQKKFWGKKIELKKIWKKKWIKKNWIKKNLNLKKNWINPPPPKKIGDPQKNWTLPRDQTPSPRNQTPPRDQTPPSPDQTPPLLTESQTGVKILPWPNFVAAGKYT